MSAFALAALLGATAYLWRPGRVRLPAGPVSDGGRPDRGLLRRLRPALVALAFVAAWTLLGGVVGIVCGIVGAALGWRALGRAEGPGARQRRLELERDLPVAIHLFGACLASGSATVSALETVADAVGGATGDELAAIRMRLLLGGDPAEVWRAAGRTTALAPLGNRMARAHESGASVVAAVERVAEDLRAGARARTEARARSVEVRAAAPLGLCLLPSFVFLGVIPMIAGVFGSLSFLR